MYVYETLPVILPRFSFQLTFHIFFTYRPRNIKLTKSFSVKQLSERFLFNNYICYGIEKLYLDLCVLELHLKARSVSITFPLSVLKRSTYYNVKTTFEYNFRNALNLRILFFHPYIIV